MVEWRNIWEVTTWDKKFSGVDKSMQPKVIKYYYYLANELADLEKQGGDVRILYTTNKEAYTNSSDVDGNIAEGEVVTIPWGGNVNIQYYKGKFVTADNRIATSNDINYLLNKYLYYWMLSQKGEIEKMYRGAGIKHPSMLSVLSMQIAIPPLQEQNRIVGILDTFTASIDNLKEQIAQRRKQYEFYRDQLLDLEGKEGVEMKTLGDIAFTKVGPFGSLLHKRDYIKGGIPLVNPVQMINGKVVKDDSFTVSIDLAKKLDNYRLNADDIVFARRGEIGRCAMITENEKNYLCGTGSLIVRFKEFVNSKFMLFLFLSPICRYYLEKSAIGGTMLNINCDIVGKMPIPIPSLQEQQRIVSILDTFEASIQNLEAQLKEREKQYEYYRNKLLTFD